MSLPKEANNNLNNDYKKILEEFAEVSKGIARWAPRINKLDELGFIEESILVDLFIIEELLRQAIKTFSYLQRELIKKLFPKDVSDNLVLVTDAYEAANTDKVTFGQLVSMYKKFRPHKTELIAILESTIKPRNNLVHNFLRKPLVKIFESMPIEFRTKPTKEIMHAIISDIGEVLDAMKKHNP